MHCGCMIFGIELFTDADIQVDGENISHFLCYTLTVKNKAIFLMTLVKVTFKAFSITDAPINQAPAIYSCFKRTYLSHI